MVTTRSHPASSKRPPRSSHKVAKAPKSVSFLGQDELHQQPSIDTDTANSKGSGKRGNTIIKNSSFKAVWTPKISDTVSISSPLHSSASHKRKGNAPAKNASSSQQLRIRSTRSLAQAKLSLKPLPSDEWDDTSASVDPDAIDRIKAKLERRWWELIISKLSPKNVNYSAWIAEMEHWLKHVPHEGMALSPQSVNRIIMSVKSLYCGFGMPEQTRTVGCVMLKGKEVDMRTNMNILYEQAANEGFQRHSGKGRLQEALAKLELFQEHYWKVKMSATLDKFDPMKRTVELIATIIPSPTAASTPKAMSPIIPRILPPSTSTSTSNKQPPPTILPTLIRPAAGDDNSMIGNFKKKIDNPTCQTSENQQHFILLLDLPGYQATDIKISVDCRKHNDGQEMIVTVTGKRVNRLYEATLHREVRLRGCRLQLDKIDAEMGRGLLTVTVPKMKSLRRKIMVRTSPVDDRGPAHTGEPEVVEIL